MDAVAATLFAALQESGMPEVPERFSVALAHQEITKAILTEIDNFIRTFDRVTTRSAWHENGPVSVPEIARPKRDEVCFFSAWDFHLPTEEPAAWQLIECNDNGSGFLFAALINRVFYEIFGLHRDPAIEPPPEFATVADRVASMVERETREFFGEFPREVFLILDDRESLERGKFRHELILLRGLLRQRGWRAELAAPQEIRRNGTHLLWQEQEVSFVVNRSTDFFWYDAVFSPLRAAYQAGQTYVAPNPYTYATRSDKRLLELLSRPDWDAQLDIEAAERALLSAHVPETSLLRDNNVTTSCAAKRGWCSSPSTALPAAVCSQARTAAPDEGRGLCGAATGPELDGLREGETALAQPLPRIVRRRCWPIHVATLGHCAVRSGDGRCQSAPGA